MSEFSEGVGDGIGMGAPLGALLMGILLSCHSSNNHRLSLTTCTPIHAGMLTPDIGGPGITWSDVQCPDSSRWRVYHAPKRIRLP